MENNQNSRISCDVCQDLIPLVQDGVASQDSVLLVRAHIEGCPSCKAVYEESPPIEEYHINDERVLSLIKKGIICTGLLTLISGGLVGIALSNSQGMFYNFLIMPIVGALGKILLNKKWFWAPITIFALSYIAIFVQGLLAGMTGELSIMMAMPLFLSTIYLILILIGVVIADLLQYAFRKEL